MDIEKFKKEVKQPYYSNYSPKVEAEGYTMALGIGQNKDGYTLEVRLQPNEGSPDPIPVEVLDKIKNEVLPGTYKGTQVNVEYLGIVKAR